MLDRTVIVDTNYLIQVNQKDILGMFFDPKYENTVASPLKRQMAKLFRNVMNRKIDLGFSNFIMREFIGRVPKRSDLLEIFKRYITIISPRDNLETCFLDLAASINSRTIDVGQECDVKDTYSYILALLAGVRYFVSEDSDLERLYEYLTRVRGMDSQAKAREIRRIRDVYRLLCDIPESTFPVEDVLRFLFLGSDPLTVPISISRIQAQLPDVLDKAHMMLSILRTLRKADLMRKSVGDKTEGLDVALLEKARSRVREVAKDIGVDHTASTELIAARLVEEEAKWKEHPSD